MKAVLIPILLMTFACSACSDELSRSEAKRILQQRLQEPAYSKVSGLVELSTWNAGSLLRHGNYGAKTEGCVKCVTEGVNTILRIDNDSPQAAIAELNKETNISFRLDQIKHLKRLYSLGIVERFSFSHPSVILRVHLKPEFDRLCPEQVNKRSGQVGEVTCQLGAGSRFVDEITGIQKIVESDNTYFRAEFTVGYALIKTVDAWCTEKPSTETHSALFSRFDDGWRLTNWNVFPDKRFDCTTGRE